jgi:hypothetical protein
MNPQTQTELVRLVLRHGPNLMEKALAACQFGIELRAKRTMRLARRVGLAPSNPRMKEHVSRMEMRNLRKMARALSSRKV